MHCWFYFWLFVSWFLFACLSPLLCILCFIIVMFCFFVILFCFYASACLFVSHKSSFVSYLFHIRYFLLLFTNHIFELRWYRFVYYCFHRRCSCLDFLLAHLSIFSCFICFTFFICLLVFLPFLLLFLLFIFYFYLFSFIFQIILDTYFC